MMHVDRPMTLTHFVLALFISFHCIFFICTRCGKSSGISVQGIQNTCECCCFLHCSAALLHTHRTNWWKCPVRHAICAIR